MVSFYELGEELINLDTVQCIRYNEGGKEITLWYTSGQIGVGKIKDIEIKEWRKIKSSLKQLSRCI